MRIPPDIFYQLPPAVIFLVIAALVGAVTLALQAAFRITRLRNSAAELSKITTAGVTVAGALFGLSMTFLANAVWTSEDQARETVNAEARAVRVMHAYLASMTEPTREGLSRLLADYGRAVASEWETMAGAGGSAEAEQALRNVYAAVIRGFAEGDQNRVLQQRLLTSLDALSAARQQRLSIALNYVSVSQWILVTGLGVVLLVLMAASHADFPLAQRVVVVATALAISVMLFVIILHDRPFIGYRALSPDIILRATGALA